MTYEEVEEVLPHISEEFFNKIKKEADTAHELDGKYYVYLSEEDSILEHDASQIRYKYDGKEHSSLENYIKAVKDNDDKDEIKNVSREFLTEQYADSKTALAFVALAPTMEELNKMWEEL